MSNIFDNIPEKEQESQSPGGYPRFTLPRFVNYEDVAQATTTLRSLLLQKDKLREAIGGELPWTSNWRVDFHYLLDQLNQPNAHATLDWLFGIADDLTDPAKSLDLPYRIDQWGHIGEQLIGARAVGSLLLEALKREGKRLKKEMEYFAAETQAAAARNTFELMTAIKITEVEAPGKTKEKSVAPSSVPMSETNVNAGRIRLYRDKLDEFEKREIEIGERIDYLQQCVTVLEETYDLLRHISIQNQGLRKNNFQQGA